MSRPASDALVIGGGIAGCFIALRLAQKGLAVRLLDAGPLFRQASGRSGGGVRQQFREPAELPLARLAVDLWGGLAEELGEDLEYRRHGSLRLHTTRELHEKDLPRVARENAAGLPVKLLTPAEVRVRLPFLAPELEFFGGTLCASDGTANPLLLGRALGPALGRAGVTLGLHEPVEAILQTRGRVTGVHTRAGEYRAPRVVLAAGPWSRELAARAGLALPLRFRKSQILVSEPVSPLVPGFVSFEQGYLRQALDGNLHLGMRGIPIEEPDTSQAKESFTWVARGYLPVFPGLARLGIIRGFAGVTNWTPDGLPILDRAPAPAGLWLATGFSGHGFCLGPAVGRLMADWLVEGRPGLDLAAFRLDRFFPPAPDAAGVSLSGARP